MSNTTTTETVTTLDLRVGDVVRNYGMRILLDSEPTEWNDDRSGRAVRSFVGTVLNPEDVRDDAMLWGFLHEYVWDEEAGRRVCKFTGRWNVQGNVWATWAREV